MFRLTVHSRISAFCYRANADTFSESVVSLDVVIKLFHSLSSQCGAVVSFIRIQQHCKGVEDGQNVMGVIHTGREILMEKNTHIKSTFQHPVRLCNTGGVLLTVGDGEQRAVRCVHVTFCYIVSLCRPANSSIVLNIKLLNKNKTKKTGINAD